MSVGEQSIGQSNSGPPNRSRRIPYLDLLRFVAAMAVVLFHFCSAPVVAGQVARDTFGGVARVTRFGYLGVELFFLISGFVIVMSAQSRSARGFLVHRALRLYPSFWVAVLLTAAAVTIWGPESERPSLTGLLANLTMLPGYLGATRIDDVYWTLAVELKFYAVVAALLVLGLAKRVDLIALLWLFLLILTEFDFGGTWLKSLVIFPHGAFFAAGTLVYMRFAQGWSTARVLGLLVAWLLALRSADRAVPDFMYAPSSLDRTIVAAIVTGSFLLLIWATRPSSPSKFARILTQLGALTYPLYLTHGRIGRLIFARLEQGLGQAGALLVESVIVGALAWLIVIFVERRLIPAISKSTVFRKAAGEYVSGPPIGASQ